MTDQPTLRRHADLVDRMATTLGLDLEEIMMAGQLQIDTLGDAVLACTGCSNPDGCARWMNAQLQPVAATPDMCRNADLFSLLKQGKRA